PAPPPTPSNTLTGWSRPWSESHASWKSNARLGRFSCARQPQEIPATSRCTRRCSPSALLLGSKSSSVPPTAGAFVSPPLHPPCAAPPHLPSPRNGFYFCRPRPQGLGPHFPPPALIQVRAAPPAARACHVCARALSRWRPPHGRRQSGSGRRRGH